MYYFFNRMNPGSSKKRYLRAVDSHTNEPMISELLKFLDAHELYTASVSEDVTLITFCDGYYTLMAYPSQTSDRMLKLETIDWEGNPVSIKIPADQFSVYEDGVRLIIGDLL